jgi:S1-C subfamily serine protease
MPVEQSIVHISIQSVGINYRKPSSTLDPRATMGSGWVADLFELADFQDRDNPLYLEWIKKLGIPINEAGQAIVIVSNAHVVHRQVSVQVRVSDSSKKYDAKIVGLAHDRDLAILIVQDKTFVKKVQPYSVEQKLPAKETKIVSYGFAQNGTDLAFSDGVFSRTTSLNYSFSSVKLLNLEVTAAINPGCSGGVICNPATNQVIGIIHQVSTGANQQSYAIPVIYLRNVARELLLYGKIFGVPSLFITREALQDSTKRAYYGLDPAGEDGVFIYNVLSQHQTSLSPGDIILEIDGNPVKSDCTVNLEGLNVSFDAIVQMRLIFESVRLRVLRNKEIMTLNVALNDTLIELMTVPSCPKETPPPYLFRHGVLFSTLNGLLNQQCKNAAGQNLTPASLYRHIAESPVKTKASRSVVFVQLMGGQDLAGYGTAFENTVVTHINGKPIIDIWTVKHILDALPQDEKFLRLRTEDSAVDNLIVPLINQKKDVSYQNLYKIHTPVALVSHFNMWKKITNAVGFTRYIEKLSRKKAVSNTLPEDTKFNTCEGGRASPSLDAC